MIFLKELIRFSTQHRTLYCYLVLSIWIFLLIGGMYKYIGDTYNTNSFLSSKHLYYLSNGIEEQNLKLEKYKQQCTPVENLTRKDDGGLLDGWKLHGVLLVIRHGDRGPMSHVKGMENVNCGISSSDPLLNRYKAFLMNTSNPSGTNHLYWNKVGPFHSFPLLPLTEKSCFLGQLTYKGIVQLLHVGDILHQVYAHPLGLLSKQRISGSGINSTPHTLLNSDEIVIFSTRYRRTFQSAMALMFSFIPPEKWISLNVKESHSMAFCFSDCACPQVDVLRKKLSWFNSDELGQHPAVANIIQWVGRALVQYSTNVITSPHEVIDAVLAILCHDAPLPCKKGDNNRREMQKKMSGQFRNSNNANNNNNTITISPPTTIELNDFINIDQDNLVLDSIDTQKFNVRHLEEGDQQKSAEKLDESDDADNINRLDDCLEVNHISALMSFINWQSSREVKHFLYRRIGLLRAYGLIRHIVSVMLKMISGDRTKFVLYSGHDWTMQYLTAALGIDTEISFIPYATRMAFEIYQSYTRTDYYFRVVYNGKDVTQQIDFCEGGKSLRVSRGSRGNKADLCPIENIIRFIHDDYFSPLNATNFKDACTF